MINTGPRIFTVLALAVLWSWNLPAAFCEPPDLRAILQKVSQAAEEIESSRDQIDIFIKLVDAYRKMGDQTEAEAALARALISAKSKESRYSIGALESIAEAQARMGKANEAKMTLQEGLHTQSPSDREILSIATTLAALGDLPAALSSVETIKDAQVKDNALRTIAHGLVISGYFAAASQIADLAKGETRTNIMYAIAMRQVFTGQIEDASKTANGLEDWTLYRVAFLSQFAPAQAKAGDRDGAAKTIEVALRETSLIKTNLESDWDHDYALSKIAAAQARLGDLAGAFKTASLVRDPSNKSYSLDSIAMTQVSMGDFKGALETASGLNDTWLDNIRQAIGRAQVRAGDIHEALQTADSMVDGYQKDELLDAIAVAQAKSGDWASATATFARSRTDRHFPQELRTDGLTEMAEALATRGGVQAAYEWSMSQKTPRARALALIGVAKGMLNSN